MKQQKHVYEYDACGNLTYETAQGDKSADYKLKNLNQITGGDDGWKTSTTCIYRIKLQL